MAIDLINKKDENEKSGQQPQGQSPQGPQAAQTSSESAFGGGGGGRVAAPQAQANVGAARKGGTGFTNLSRIVNANKDNKLGQAVSTGVQRTVGDVKQGLGQARSQFQQGMQANKLDTEENKQAQQNLINRYSYEQANQEQAGPSEQEIALMQKLQEGKYGGPQALENEQELLAKSKIAEGLGQAAGSQEGRLNLLNRFAANKGYTTGQKRLDNLLLGQSAGSALKQARRESMGLGQQADIEAETARQQALGAIESSRGVSEATKAGLKSAAQKYAEKLGARATEAQQAYDENIKSIKEQLASGNVSQEVADKLGLKAGQRLYGADLQKAFDVIDKKANEENVASKAEAASISALQKLAGGNLQGGIYDKFRDASKAGSFGEADALAGIRNIGADVASMETGVKGGGEWQTAERKQNEAGAALSGLDRYQKAEQSAQDWIGSKGKSIKDYTFDRNQNKFVSTDKNMTPQQEKVIQDSDAYALGEINRYGKRVVNDPKTGKPIGYQTGTRIVGMDEYQGILDRQASRDQMKALESEWGGLSKEHKAAEAEAAMGGGSAFWQTHDPNAARQFEEQKRAEAQSNLEKMMGGKVGISDSKLKSIKDILARR
jgi:hypothetical protein